MFSERTTLQRLLLLKALSGGGQTLVERTALGNPLTFITDKAKPLKSLLIPFTPQQEGSGNPSPENIRSILPWNGLTVFGGGKNLFNVNSAFQNPSDTSYENNTKRIFTPITYCLGLSATNFFDTSKVIGYSIQDNVLTLTENGGYGIGFALPLKSGKRYTIQCDGTNFRANGAFYAKDGSLISTQNSILYEGTRPSYQFVVPENTEMTVVVFVCKTSGQEAIFRNIQIEYADTATAYEPYHPITDTDISFPSPVYGGSAEIVSGAMAQTILFVSAKWKDFEGNTAYTDTVRRDLVIPYNCLYGSAGNGKTLCNMAKYKYNNDDDPHFYLTDAKRIRCFMPKDMDGETEITFTCALAEPIPLESIEPHHLTALVGDNTIWSDADGSMTAVYLVSSKYAEEHPVGGLGSGLLGSGTEDNPEDPAEDPIEDPIEDPEEEIPDNTEEGSEPDD